MRALSFPPPELLLAAGFPPRPTLAPSFVLDGIILTTRSPPPQTLSSRSARFLSTHYTTKYLAKSDSRLICEILGYTTPSLALQQPRTSSMHVRTFRGTPRITKLHNGYAAYLLSAPQVLSSHFGMRLAAGGLDFNKG